MNYPNNLIINKIMKSIALVLLTAVLLAAAGCKSEKDRVSKLWFYTHSSRTSLSADPALTPASFLLLRPDGSYTRDFGKYEFGSWTISGEALSLTNHNGDQQLLPFKLNGKNTMQVAAGSNETANFEAITNSFAKSDLNPFDEQFNQWRIPARKKESNEEIKKRLLNHCRFWETYFYWALENEMSSIDVRSTPTLIKIYGNGFALKPANDLPAAWKSYFFDEEDCAEANGIMQEIFETGTIAWAKTDNKYKMFISAFQQMQQALK
jgi:hypothetical protein